MGIRKSVSTIPKFPVCVNRSSRLSTKSKRTSMAFFFFFGMSCGFRFLTEGKKMWVGFKTAYIRTKKPLRIQITLYFAERISGSLKYF